MSHFWSSATLHPHYNIIWNDRMVWINLVVSSLKNFNFIIRVLLGKAEKTIVKVVKDTGNSVIKSIASVVTKSFEGAVVPT